MDNHRFAGYGIVEFGQETKKTLKEIAERLQPHQEDILQLWVAMQWRAWQPPGLSRPDLEHTFGSLFRNLLKRMRRSEIEESLEDLEQAGKDLAERTFPFQALIISIHFLEESYLPYLLSPASKRTQDWLISMDAFLHSALAAIANSYFEAHRKELLDQAEVSRIVQEELLAKIPRRAQDLEIAHVYVAAHETSRLGGDFLDFFDIDGLGPAFIIGDLSGHGLEAAADSVMLRSLFRAFMREEPDLARTMERMNRVLVHDLRPDQFATALAGVYDLSGQLSLVSAGHPLPIMCTDACQLLNVSGCALAVTAGSRYRVDMLAMPPGSVFVAYTDGLTEARRGHDLFGEDRVVEAATKMWDISARAVAEHLIDEALRHAGGKFTDDVAVLVLKRREGGK